MSGNQFSTLREDIRERWSRAAEVEGIQKEAYQPDIRIVKDTSGKSGYTFGIIRNEHRFKRAGAEPGQPEQGSCNLCNAVQLVLENPMRNIMLNHKLLDFVITPNKFPIIEGFSMAVAKEERPMFTTKNLEGVADELAAILDFADRTGFEVFHNSPGFGATIPSHEHWHLTTFRRGYDVAGDIYGFDAAEKTSIKGFRGVGIMPEFPFAHLIFDSTESSRLVNFLSRLHEGESHKYEEGSIPHIIAQGYEGLLVAPGKNYLSRGRGSGDIAGHLVVKSEEEFSSMNFEKCFAEIDKLLFKKEDADLSIYL